MNDIQYYMYRLPTGIGFDFDGFGQITGCLECNAER